MNSPFKFLDAYTAKDKDLFFGRDKEVKELYNKVLMTSLVLVYGKSGTGKSSHNGPYAVVGAQGQSFGQAISGPRLVSALYPAGG